MFETITQFLWFFIPTLALICIGIWKEEKLIAFEDRVLKKIKKAVKHNV